MKKFLLAGLLALLPLAAAAQGTTYSPSLGGGTAFTGGAITSALAAPAADNCAAVPYSFTGDTNTGLCTSAADTFDLYTAGASRLSGNSTAVTSTVPIYIANGTAAAPSLAFTSDADGNGTGIYRSAANVLTIANNGVAYWNFAGANFYPTTTDGSAIGSTNALFYALYLSRHIQGSKSKALTDATATAFVRVGIAQTAGSNYGGGQVIFEIFCKDATNQASQSGRVSFTCHNLAGTEACGFGTPDVVTLGDGTASLGTPAFDAATGATDTIDLRVSSDCTGVTPTTHTIEYRLDMPNIRTITPQ